MKILNIASMQLESGGEMEEVIQNHSAFFQEYFKVFASEDTFCQDVKRVIERYSPKRLRDFSQQIEEKIQGLESRIQLVAKMLQIPEIVILIGPGQWDGHGILVDEKAYTFFDLTAMVQMMHQFPNFNQPVHLLHEIFHGIHYHYGPEFYPGNYTSLRDDFLKRMLAEGIAEYLSESVTGDHQENILWFGLLDKTTYQQWAVQCEKEKARLWKAAKKDVAINLSKTPLLGKFFSVYGLSPEELIKGRYGYYYGYQIIQDVAGDVRLTKLLEMPLHHFREYVESFFAI